MKFKVKIKHLLTNISGFSLVELIVVIAIMAVMAAVLVPALLGYVEKSRMQKDASIMSEVVNSMKLSIADQEIYDELLQASVKNNYSCYADGDTTTNIDANKTMLKDPEYWLYNDSARLLDETAYFPSGKMRGVTITFRPDGKYNYVLKDGIINQMGVALTKKGPNAGKTLEDSMFTATYNRLRSTVGDSFKVSSQTYRNSDYTIFISMGTTGGNQATNQDAIQVWGQYNGTNLSEVAAPVAGGQQGIVNPGEDDGSGEVDLTKATGGLYEYIGGPLKQITVNGEQVEATWANLIEGDYIAFDNRVLSNAAKTSQLSGVFVVDKSTREIKNDTWDSKNNFLYGSQVTEIAFEEGTKSLGTYGISHLESLTTVHLPASLEEFSTSSFTYCANLKEITVPGNSQHFKIVDDCLYSKDGTTLYKVPSKINKTELYIQDGVTNIVKQACNYTNLKKIVVPSSCKAITQFAFIGNPVLEEFIVNGDCDLSKPAIWRECPKVNIILNGSTKFVVKDGLLMNAQKTTVYFVIGQPETVVIPQGVTKIVHSAFHTTNVKHIILPKSLTAIDAYQIFKKLETIQFEGTQAQFAAIVVSLDGSSDTTQTRLDAATKTYNYSY